jgi:hypothetical protein
LTVGSIGENPMERKASETKKRKVTEKESVPEKKVKGTPNGGLKAQLEALGPILAKGVSKVRSRTREHLCCI